MISLGVHIYLVSLQIRGQNPNLLIPTLPKGFSLAPYYDQAARPSEKLKLEA